MPSRRSINIINSCTKMSLATRTHPIPRRSRRPKLSKARASTSSNFSTPIPKEYLAIFTSNASGALKLVGKSYPFPNGRYLLTFDNHNSVNGIREFAHARGAEVTYIPVMLPDMRANASQLDLELARPSEERTQPFCLPRPVELLLGQTSAGVDRESPRSRLGCVARRGGLCPNQQTGPEQGQA